MKVTEQIDKTNFSSSELDRSFWYKLVSKFSNLHYLVFLIKITFSVTKLEINEEKFVVAILVTQVSFQYK